MKLTDRLLRLAAAYMAATGVYERDLSSNLFGHTRKLADLKTGSGITVRKAEKALEWFDNNWPEGVAMPGNSARHGRNKSRQAANTEKEPVASTLYNGEPPTPKIEEFPKHEQA